MKTISIILSLSILMLSCEKEIDFPIEEIRFDIPENTHPQGETFQAVLDIFASKGLVGISLAVDDPAKGFWAGAAGKACLEDGTDMNKYHLHHSASVAKLYIGTAIMLLVEDGLIELEAKMDKYLPSSICDKISYGHEITVYQLMSHTSGLFDWMDNPQEYFDYLNNPFHSPSKNQLLEYLYDQPAEFSPGQRFGYSNSNMMLLALIIDHVTQEDHSVFIKERLFDPLGLEQSYYKIQEGYPTPKGLTNSYSNFYNDGRIINISDYYGNRWCAMIGDDALIASPYDYLQFIKALFEGNILKAETLEVMRERRSRTGNTRCQHYGLAMTVWYSRTGNYYGRGHDGTTEGAGAQLFYFPKTGITIALFTNTGVTRKEGPLFYDQLWPEIVRIAHSH